MAIKEAIRHVFDRLTSDGKEKADPTPAALPVGYKHPLSLDQKIQLMVRSAVSAAADEQGYETFDEANDFEIGDNDPMDSTFDDEDTAIAVNDPYVKEAVNDLRRKEVDKQGQEILKKYSKKPVRAKPEAESSPEPKGEDGDEN